MAHYHSQANRELQEVIDRTRQELEAQEQEAHQSSEQWKLSLLEESRKGKLLEEQLHTSQVRSPVFIILHCCMCE